jgi:S-disulfanyl-L-cysteine oxidoreductase SoxD
MKASVPFLLACGLTVLAATVGAQQGSTTTTTSTTTTAGKTTNDGVFTDAQSKRGAEAYQMACAACHDAQLVGSGTAPALTGADFNANWKDETVGSLFERIRLTMPGDNPGSLSRQQSADIVAFILGFNKAPAGQTELGTDTDALKAIKIAAAK